MMTPQTGIPGIANAQQPQIPGEPSSARVTINDVARAAQVSVSTVSKVVNGRYGVAPATIAKVHQVISELGYETSLVASSLRSTRTNIIGILVAEFEPFSLGLLNGISATLRGTQYDLMAYAGNLSPEGHAGWERRSLSRLGGTLIDGAIIVTPTVEVPHSSVPVVAIDPHAGPEMPIAIDVDNRSGAYTATRHLLDLGHRRIGHIRGRGDLASAHLREQGYRQALEEAGVEFDGQLSHDGDYQHDAAVQAAHDLLDLPQPPTAIFAANDLSALAALQVAGERGLQVPGDLSIIGFDDIPAAAQSSPPLSTVRQPLHEMGAQAVSMLLGLLAGEDVRSPGHLPAVLVPRETTGPARSS
ncbi:LacI family transcriptional regulator [Arthrobacter sp. JUb119]|nr:LacI family transcriptional regulator [Arthrobacter sp. JUb119]